ncbi:MAG TPA: gamma-glutamylcyclotransferase [Nitrospira sp.]|nr:gamma-glutamylcyclotransferase [Nitrospira sp.]
MSDYALRFNKEGQDRSGKANLVPCQGEKVWGILYEISEEEFARLAPFEPGYRSTTLEVTIQSSDQTCVAQAFLADATKPERLPSSAYLQLILRGADEHGLPPDHCHTLRQVKTSAR